MTWRVFVCSTMVSLAVRCSTWFVIAVYFSGVEPHDTEPRVDNTEKKQDETQHDISVYFRPMLGKRTSYFVPRLGKRAPDDENTPSSLWESSDSDVTDSHETDSPQYQPDTAHHPVMLRWYTPRLGKRMGYYTPRLGRRDTDENCAPCPLWETEDALGYGLPKERRGGKKEDKAWKVVGMFNPRLGRSVQPDFEQAKDIKNSAGFSSD